ncbi:hypothetical protein [Lacinutrix sp. MedPE-SW]|uniref:hypothetical protein n=1 Tax=Lacinutrix sp. MedPE-SW TaxID=1860087 RepID=UPI000920A371|nr:hypothetical protein [Lacinutrix sp. MedPE-SW]OIQ23635.1 MAG: hypothetical protein BM549_03460 [Lacinutrix sp. MedPE-SW]
MKKVQLLYFILIPFLLIAQDSIPSIKFEALKTNYKDFIIIDNEIYSITKGDSLVIWDIKTNTINGIKSNINTIAKSHKNRLVATTTKGQVLEFINDNNWKQKDTFKGEAFSTFITSKNKTLILSNRGIYLDKKLFYPKGRNRIYNSRHRSTDTITKYLRKPSLSYLDKENRLWLTYDRGEFGQYTWFFDINKKTFFEEEYLDINSHLTYKEEKKWNKEHDYKKAVIDTFPTKIKLIHNELIYKFPAQIPIHNGVKGIAEDKNGKIFISQSTHHFFISGGISIYSKTKFLDFYNSISIDYILEHTEREIVRNNKKVTVKKLVEYLGPVTYNPYNDSMYYYSNKGFFKIIEKGKKFSKELIFKPILFWKGGLPHSVGSQMAVKKFEFIDEKRFVFLTNLNGLGYYNGHKIKYYR